MVVFCYDVPAATGYACLNLCLLIYRVGFIHLAFVLSIHHVLSVQYKNTLTSRKSSSADHHPTCSIVLSSALLLIYKLSTTKQWNMAK